MAAITKQLDAKPKLEQPVAGIIALVLPPWRMFHGLPWRWARRQTLSAAGRTVTGNSGVR
jgi:hypothetical protein